MSWLNCSHAVLPLQLQKMEWIPQMQGQGLVPAGLASRSFVSLSLSVSFSGSVSLSLSLSPQQPQDFVIKPSSVTPPLDTSKWPLLLRVRH